MADTPVLHTLRRTTLAVSHAVPVLRGYVSFTTGGTTEITVGNTVTGATTGDSGTVIEVTLTSGTWAGGNAVGKLYLSEITKLSGGELPFQASENIQVGGVTRAVAANPPSVFELGHAFRDDLRGTGGAVAVEDEGTEVVAVASRLNFAGAGVTATDAGAGEATITIPGGGSSTLDGLSDVVVTTPADNEVLAFDTTGGNWINQTAAEAGLSVSGHTHAASGITFSPSGGVASTDVQAAIVELDSEKSATGHNHDATYQPLDASLTALAGVTTAADKLTYATAADTFATTDFTAFARTLLDDAAASNARTTLGLVIGTDVQAFDANNVAEAHSSVSPVTNTLTYNANSRRRASFYSALDQNINSTPGSISFTNFPAGQLCVARIVLEAITSNRTVPVAAFPTGFTVSSDWDATIVVGDPRLVSVMTFDGGTTGYVTHNSGFTIDLTQDVTGLLPWANIALLNSLTEKVTPVNGDLVVIADSAASNAHKYAQLGNLPGTGGGINNVVEDLTPQLGGALDMNGQNITAAGPTTITPTEMSYLDGVTSAIQTQIDGKAATSHTHAPTALSFAATDRLAGRDTAGAGAGEEIAVSGGIEFTGAGGIQTSAFTGDVTKTAGGTTTTIANDAVTNAKMANMAASAFKARSTQSTGDPEDITPTQARALLDPVPQVVNAQTGTSYELVATDKGKLVTLNNAAAVTVNVDTDGITWASGERVDLLNLGAGAVTIQGGGVTPVTISKRANQTAVLAQYAGATLYFTSDTAAVLVGGMNST